MILNAGEDFANVAVPGADPVTVPAAVFVQEPPRPALEGATDRGDVGDASTARESGGASAERGAPVRMEGK